MIPAPSPGTHAAALARVAAHWLALGRSIDRLSVALTLLALATLRWTASSPSARLALAAAAVAGLAEKAYALRVAFDHAIFADWTRRWPAEDASAPERDLAAFDKALVAAGRPARAADRPLPERVRAATALLKRQAVLLVGQVTALLVAALCQDQPWLWHD